MVGLEGIEGGAEAIGRDVRDAGVPEALAAVRAARCVAKPAVLADHAATLRACLDG